ncbi:spore germination protein PC [Paenibacillus sp. DS2015]|uniref:spore germination protein GerPC n=1 Tax=Paenibacillus sp. DS2015 TaxID=3373917 RepID=UPI003D208F95
MHPYYVQQFLNELKVQSEKIQQLEKTLQELQSDVDSLKNNKSANIGPINYHFEQLKIEKLEGTLNIGITPNKENNLEELMVNGQQMGTKDTRKTALFERIRPQVVNYIQVEVPEQFYRQAKERNLIVNTQYVHMVTQDLQQQMDGRINEYLAQLPTVQEERNNDDEISASIVEQMKRDIDTAVIRHMEWNISERRDQIESDSR